MSLENEDQYMADQPAETNHESQKKLKYSRDFLLSLSEFDVCQKLPSGFDQSLLSEFEETFEVRQRTAGSVSLQSFRRNEYGSSPPTKGDVSNYNRGVPGRWESRSSGRSDRDSDSQSEWESDSGRRYGNQSRRSWPVPEHDGLLGSGSFPRPSGYAAGVSAPKLRPNDSYQLNRSNEPYHPPRPYKAVPHLRRGANDSYNDETFGSSESASEDRAEEERKRRASFELMRKEQQKAFQEKQKLNPEKRKDEFDTLLEDSKDEKRPLNKSNDLDDPVILPTSNNNSEKSSFPPQTSASRPLVPPGFKSTILERNFGPKSLVHPHPAEVGNPEVEASLSHAKDNSVLNGISDNQEEKQLAEQKSLSEQPRGSTSINISFNNKSEKPLNVTSTKRIDVDSGLYKNSNIAEAFEAPENSEVIELHTEKVTGNIIVGESDQRDSTSILDKLFGTALTLSGGGGGGSSSFVEHHDSKADETRIPHIVQSSKFARWFLEEEKKPVDDLSSSRPNDLLSLIVGGEKGGSQVSDVKNTEQILPSFPLQSSKPAERHLTSNVTSATAENSEQLYKNHKSEAVPSVLTCEDLEQSILSGISENGSTVLPPVQVSSVPDAKTAQPKAKIDDRASHHLLSLLQKGTNLKEMAPAPLDIQLSEQLHNNEGASIGSAVQNSKEAHAENSSNSGQTLTLETLFGTAFMKELQSVGAPVSVQRGSVGSMRVDVSEPRGFPFPVVDDDLLTTKEIGSNTTNHESSGLTLKQRLQTKPVKTDEQWLGFGDPQTELDPSQLRTGLGSNLGGFDGPVEIRLPEEDSLITVNDALNRQNYVAAGNSAKIELLPPSNAQVDISEKLAALNSIFKDERSVIRGQEGPPFLRGPYDVREPDIPYQNLSAQPSSPQLHPPHSNHAGYSHPANVNSQMKYMAPEGIIHHDPPPNHQFPASMFRPPFHHHSTGLTGFDPPSHHPMLQQMHMPGNFPPPHLVQGFPRSAPLPAHPNRGAPLPPHLNNQVTGLIPELNPLQPFPLGHRQPNFASFGMPPPAPDVGGSNHPEAIQRFIEMELRSNSKQIQPFAGGGHSKGHELDMGFGYR